MTVEPSSPSGSVSRRLDLWLEPDEAFRTLAAGADYMVWKDAGLSEAGGTSFIGFTADRAAAILPAGEPGLAGFIETLRGRIELSNAIDPADAGFLGWWGWFGYEARSDALDVPSAVAETPNAAFMFVDRGIRFDHAIRTLTLIGLHDSSELTAWLDETEHDLNTHLERRQSAASLSVSAPSVSVPSGTATAAGIPAASGSPRPVSWRHERPDYLSMIEACQAAITRGDAYQICLTNMIEVGLGDYQNPAEVYLRMRELSPTSHGGLLRMGPWSLLSGSPEQFLRVDTTGRARTRPIKGTRRRGTTPEEDEALITELVTSDKERAENLMIVDLMRNDLSRVSRVGSVEVTQLFAVETYPNVHQLVSTVESDLAADGLAASVALFPPGSMTGAPKISAMTILARLENGPRGIYSGVWGSFAIDGSVDLAVVIRSIVMSAGRATIGTGGGITALSDPEDEWDEIVLKAAPMLAALEPG